MVFVVRFEVEQFHSLSRIEKSSLLFLQALFYSYERWDVTTTGSFFGEARSLSKISNEMKRVEQTWNLFPLRPFYN